MRVTTKIKKEIISSLLTHKFGKDVEKFQSDQRKFADKVYKTLYKSATRLKMEALPKGWLRKSCSINVQFGGSYAHLSFNGHYGEITNLKQEIENKQWHRVSKSPHDERLLTNEYATGCAKVFDSSSPLSIEHQDLVVAGDKLKEKMRDHRLQLEGTLSQFTTVKKLVETWPEIEPFTPKVNEANKLPAIPVKSLNKTFDLPTKEAA